MTQANLTKSVKSCRFLSVKPTAAIKKTKKGDGSRHLLFLGLITSQVLAENNQSCYWRATYLVMSAQLAAVSAVVKADRRRGGVHSDHRVSVGAIIPAARGAYAQWAGAGGVVRNRNCRGRCAAQHVVIAALGAGCSSATHNVIDQASVCGNWCCAIEGARSKDCQGRGKARST